MYEIQVGPALVLQPASEISGLLYSRIVSSRLQHPGLFLDCPCLVWCPEAKLGPAPPRLDTAWETQEVSYKGRDFRKPSKYLRFGPRCPLSIFLKDCSKGRPPAWGFKEVCETGFDKMKAHSSTARGRHRGFPLPARDHTPIEFRPSPHY